MLPPPPSRASRASRPTTPRSRLSSTTSVPTSARSRSSASPRTPTASRPATTRSPSARSPASSSRRGSSSPVSTSSSTVSPHHGSAIAYHADRLRACRRHCVLRQLRHQGPVPDAGRDQHRQRVHDPAGHVGYRALRPSPAAHLGRGRDVHLRVPRRDHRRHHLGAQHVRPEGARRARVHLHRRVRVHVGPHRVGRRRRDLPAQRPCKGHVARRRVQLALELWHRLRDAVPRQHRPRQRGPPGQGVLHLGLDVRVLHHLLLLLHPRGTSRSSCLVVHHR